MLGLGLGLGFADNVKTSAWSPLTDPATLAWWTADRADLITLSGAKVTQWLDAKAGNPLVQATDAARPLYSATSFNGAPGVTFDGTAATMSTTTIPLANDQPGEFWAVLSQDALVADATQRAALYQGSGASTARGVRRIVSGGVSRLRVVASNVSATQTAGVFEGRHVIRSKFETAQITPVMDGVAGTPVAFTPAVDAAAFIVGSYVGSLFWQGSIRDVWVASPSADFASAEAFFAARRLP